MKWIAALLGLAILCFGIWFVIEGRGAAPPRGESAAIVRKESTKPEGRTRALLADGRVPIESESNPPQPRLEPAAERDPTRDEIEGFQGTTSPGTIEGIVLRGVVPVAGGKAWLGDEQKGGLPWGSWEGWDAASHVERAEIGSNGIFRFEGLQPGDYGLGVRTQDGMTRHVYVTVHSGTGPVDRTLIVFGAAGMRGHVYDDRGVACRGWEIAVAGQGYQLTGQQTIDRARTDSTGAYEVPGLVGGRYMVQTSPTGDFRDPNARTRFADVPASAWATVDIGSPRGTFAWTGRLLQPRGMPIALLDAAEIRLEATGREERAAIAADGSFGMRLAPATYATRLFVFAAGCELSLDPLEISEHDVERDLRVPAAVLRVHVRFRDDIDESRRALPDLTLKEQPPRGVNSFPPLTTRRRACGADGTLYFFGVRPGEYVLLSSRPIAGSSDGSLSVQVGASDDELDLEILVEKS